MAPNNPLPIHGNEKTMNLNHLILTNIQSSPYFKVNLYELKTYHEVIDEIYYKVDHLEPWEKGSRKTAGQTGMCGGVRGVGAGGIVSSAYCLLYKLFTLKLTRKQLNGLITHNDSPYIRGLGFMYIRYTQPPSDLWDWYSEYLEDDEELDVKAGGGHVMTIGELVRQWLFKIEWYSTLFPRIPVPVQKSIEKKLKEYDASRATAVPQEVVMDDGMEAAGSGGPGGDPGHGYGEAERVARMHSGNERDRERERERDRERSHRTGSDDIARDLEREKERQRREREVVARERSSRDKDRGSREKERGSREKDRSNRDKDRANRDFDRDRERDRNRQRDERYRRSRSRERPHHVYDSRPRERRERSVSRDRKERRWSRSPHDRRDVRDGRDRHERRRSKSRERRSRSRERKRARSEERRRSRTPEPKRSRSKERREKHRHKHKHKSKSHDKEEYRSKRDRDDSRNGGH